MMRVYSGEFSAETLAQLLAAFDKWQWFYGERITQIELLAWEAVTAPTTWLHGRAFTPDAELAWWQMTPNQFEVRLMTDHLPATLETQTWERVEAWEMVEQPQMSYLHGELDGETPDKSAPPTWSVARIPRNLAYPIDPQQAAQYVGLQTATYQRHGIIGHTRLLSVSPLEE